MAYTRGVKPSDVVAVGDPIDVKILKIGKDTKKICAGAEAAAARSLVAGAAKNTKPGRAIKGKVARVADFGAFVELEPGIEGLIHVSEMSWTKQERPRAGRGEGGRPGGGGDSRRESGR